MAELVFGLVVLLLVAAIWAVIRHGDPPDDPDPQTLDTLGPDDR